MFEQPSPQLKQARERQLAECRFMPPISTKKDQLGPTLEKLAALLRWIDQAPASEPMVDLESPCHWRIEVEEGVRPRIPYGPPPFRELPDVALLVGSERTVVERALGLAPSCWQQTGALLRPSPCETALHVRYPFFRLDNGPGGGIGLDLDFDDSGRVLSADWVGEQ